MFVGGFVTITLILTSLNATIKFIVQKSIPIISPLLAKHTQNTHTFENSVIIIKLYKRACRYLTFVHPLFRKSRITFQFEQVTQRIILKHEYQNTFHLIKNDRIQTHPPHNNLLDTISFNCM